MNIDKALALFLAAVPLSGCSSFDTLEKPQGPALVTSESTSSSGQYAEVGLEFSSWGDFVAVFAPSRWKSPVAVGGSLSWINPNAWRQDAGRTGRILLGEAVLVGGVAAAGSVADDGGSSGTVGGGSSAPPPPTGGGGAPPPLPGM